MSDFFLLIFILNKYLNLNKVVNMQWCNINKVVPAVEVKFEIKENVLYLEIDKIWWPI